MKIDNISQIMRYNTLQNLSNINEGLSGNSSEILFSSVLNEMLQDSKVNYFKNKSKNNKVKNNSKPKTTNGLDSLSLQPQQMARMMRSLAEQNALSALSGNSISSTYNRYYGINNMMGESSYTTLMLGYMLGKMSQNSYLTNKL